MLRTRRLTGPVCWATGLVVLSAFGLALSPSEAAADPTDGTLTVVVERDVNADGVYDPQVDSPQAGIEVAVSDAVGAEVTGTTDTDGKFSVSATEKLSGGRYFVVAQIPADLGDLTPVPETTSFQALSTTVDVGNEDQTVRMGVAPRNEPEAEPSPARESSAPAPRPALGEQEAPRFAVGDDVFSDLDRSGQPNPGEPGVSGTSVQLLDDNGSVLDSTVTSAAGRYSFDNLAAGTYSVRFAGLPPGSTFTASGRADQAHDSNPDYTGVTPPFTLGVDEPNVRPTVATDGVSAAFINPTIDAGITALRYAVGAQVWLDANRDGVRQPEEAAESATVSLLTDERVQVASTVTDAQGRYRFSDLPAGRYRIRFTGLPPHRAFTTSARGDDPAVNSKPDRRTGLTPVFSLDQNAPNLMPAGDAGVDFVNETMNAGLVPVYSLGDTVWRDHNGDGVLDPGDGGMAGVTVRLLDDDRQVLARRTTTENGRFTFANLPAGNYRLEFTGLPPGFVFTAQHVGTNAAVDSDADASGLSQVITIGEDNPADTTVDVGVTRPTDLQAPVAATRTERTADTTLSGSAGVAIQVPLGGLALVLAGLACLYLARRRRVQERPSSS